MTPCLHKEIGVGHSVQSRPTPNPEYKGVSFLWCGFECSINASHNHQTKFEQLIFVYHALPFQYLFFLFSSV